MDDPQTLPVPPARPGGRFLGRVAFQQLVRDALACAAHEGWREIVICDPHFEDWPLGEREVIASLQAWARPGRQLTMLAIAYDEVVRRHARFVAWRTTWSHLLDCRACRSASVQDLPSAIWSPSWAMQRLDLELSSGISGDEPQQRLVLRQTLDEWLHKSSPSFPASVLGL